MRKRTVIYTAHCQPEFPNPDTCRSFAVIHARSAGILERLSNSRDCSCSFSACSATHRHLGFPTRGNWIFHFVLRGRQRDAFEPEPIDSAFASGASA